MTVSFIGWPFSYSLVMNLHEYGPIIINPDGYAVPSHVHNGQEVTQTFLDLHTDQSITVVSGTVVLLSIPFMKKDANASLKFTFTASCSNTQNNASVRFGLYIDGSRHRACGIRGGAGAGQCAALIHLEQALAEGLHTVEIRWNTDAGTASCRPVTHADDEFASLLVEELLIP